MTKLKDIENTDINELGEQIYIHKTYMVLSNENIPLAFGTLEEIKALRVTFGGYYDECTVKTREHDLYLNDNTKITPDPNTVKVTWLEGKPLPLPGTIELHGTVSDVINKTETGYNFIAVNGREVTLQEVDK